MFDTDQLRRLTADVAVLAAEPMDGLAPASMGDAALTARRLRELADHIEVHALGALEPTGYTEITTGMSAGAWFSREARLPSAVGRTQVTTARGLRHLPETDAAWLDGRLNREHVRVLTGCANPRIRDHIATLQPELIGLAEERTFHHWRLRMSEVVARLDTDGPQPDDPHHTTATWGRSGLFAELRATFAGADVELLEQIIEARTNALYRANVEEHKHSRDLPLLTRNQLRAHAIIDLILHGPDDTDLTDDHDNPDPLGTDDLEPDTDPSHIDDRGTDDLGTATDAKASDTAPLATDDLDIDGLETDDTDIVDTDSDPVDEAEPPKPTKQPTRLPSTKQKRKRSRRSRARIGIMLVLRQDDTETDGLPQLDRSVGWSLANPEGHHLALDHYASLLCDCQAHPLLVDDDDNPLILGRTTRLATLDQRRAVLIRDGGCAMPGCDCPTAWVEIHHVIWWSNGGNTDITNLVALCRRHHGITHRKGWSMHAAGDGWFWWTTPSGDTFWSQRHGRQRAGPTPPLSADIAA